MLSRRARALVVVMALGMWLAPVSAHDVVEQIVEMTLEPHSDRLVVTLHVPAAVTDDANLPRLLRGGDAGALESPLRIVAAEIAHNLEIQQGGMTLPDPIATARAGADGTSIDVELRYAVRDAAGFSARLNAFRSTDGPVRTNARYRQPSGRDNVISVTGAPARIMFDPSAAEALSQFALRGLRALLDGGDHLLFLACVLLPVRRVRSAVGLFTVVAIGQASVIAMSAAGPPMSTEWLAGAGMVAASAIVIAAMQNVARARIRWMIGLALAFGVCSGFAFGHIAAASAQFAGAHRLVAMSVFALVVLLGELWLGALTWAFRAWLDERGVPERLVSILGSAIIAHSAVHRVIDRGHVLAQTGSFGAERAVVWLTLGWIGVILLVAVSNALSGRRIDPGEPIRAAKATHAS